MTSTALLIGYDRSGKVVYQESLPLGEFYDGDLLWDDADRIKETGLVRVLGVLFGFDGSVLESFECRFSPDTGVYIDGAEYRPSPDLETTPPDSNTLALDFG